MSVGIKLVSEVLDNYQGSDYKFRWLIAFAECANDTTRLGWPGQEMMTRRTQRSASRVSHIVSELIADGIISREGGGGRNRGKARYTLLPRTSQSAPRAQPETSPQSALRAQPDGSSQVAQAATSQSAPRAQPVENDAVSFNPHRTLTPPGGAPSAPTAQTILAAFIDWDRSRGGKLTERTIGQLAKQIADLMRQGIDDRHIKTGLAAWREKGHHPSTLDSFVNAAMNAKGPHRKRESTGDRALAEAEELKAQLRGMA